jgi:hypothetical protein
MKIANINKSIGIPREELPQLDADQFDNILDSLTNYGITYKLGQAKASKLKPSQDQLNMEKIEKMIADQAYNNDSKIFISKEGYIVDGHHRWAATVVNDSSAMIGVVLVNMSIIDLIKWFNEQDFTYSKKINEAKEKTNV